MTDPKKIRTPESREAEAKKILADRAQRGAPDQNNPKQRGPLPVPLSPVERGGSKAGMKPAKKAKKAEENAEPKAE